MTETKPRPDAARAQQITEAASELFIRYGLARTTMGDIAAAAGISRPTLYASFPQKQDVFGAVIELMVSQKLAVLLSETAAYPALADRLAHVCTSWAMDGFDLVRANPDAKDMFDISFAPVRASHAAFAAMLGEILAEAGTSEPELSGELMVAAIRGFKDLARDRDHLQSLIARLCALVAADAGPA